MAFIQTNHTSDQSANVIKINNGLNKERLFFTCTYEQIREASYQEINCLEIKDAQRKVIINNYRPFRRFLSHIRKMSFGS